MGKSTKKPIIKDSNKGMKSLSHRKFRNKTKQLINQGKFDQLPDDQRQLTNPYDVSDWKFVIDKEAEHRMREGGHLTDEQIENEMNKAKRK